MKKIKLLSLLLIPLIISGCSTPRKLEFIHYEPIKEIPLPIKQNSVELTNKGRNGIKIIDTLKSYKLAGGSNSLPSTGSQQILIVPVYFSNQSISEEEKNNRTILLNNAFFGDSKQTNYQSVASYYNKSSYGRLSICGEVTPFVEVDESHLKSKEERQVITNAIVEEVATKLENSGFNLDKYCLEKDHYVDSMFLIYEGPKDVTKCDPNSIFWAYTCYNEDCKSNYKVPNYSWANFYFMGQNVLSDYNIDAKTYIHESGHLFGLEDYYNSSKIYPSYQPTGCFDMMDFNLGDHNSFSKYLLNWVKPIDAKEGRITLRSFETSGDCVIIRKKNSDGTNLTAFDEYLLIEYFTQGNLNDHSKFPSYLVTNSKGEQKVFNFPTKNGFKVYHINAKLGYFASKYATEEVTVPYDNCYIKYKNTNTIVRSSNSTVLCHLLESSGTNSFLENNPASNATLFSYNSYFDERNFANLVSDFGYTFSVKQIRSFDGTLELKRI